MVILMFSWPLQVGQISAGFEAAESEYPHLKTLDAWSTLRSATWWTFLAASCLNVYAGLGLVKGRTPSVVHRAKVLLWVTGPATLLVIGSLISRIDLEMSSGIPNLSAAWCSPFSAR